MLDRLLFPKLPHIAARVFIRTKKQTKLLGHIRTDTTSKASYCMCMFSQKTKMSSVTVFLGLLLVALLPCTVSGIISSTCLRCICLVESNCNANVACGDRGRSCGPYQIMRNYWIDGGRRGSGYRQCVDTFDCSQQTVRGYMARYATEARLGFQPTCEEFSRIHNGGPRGYKNPNTIGYWNRIQNRGCNRNS